MTTTTSSITTTTTTTILRRLGHAALGLALGAGVPACGDDGQSGASGSSGPLECEPGMSYDCGCPNGSMGTQQCASDSSGLQSCVCGGDDTPPSSSTGSADGSASASGTSDTPGSSGPDLTASGTAADGSTSASTTATSTETSTNGTAPFAQINHPGDGDMRPAGVVIPFIGEASDIEDGVLTGASLVWVDSVEGEIGQGETFDSMLFTLGEHTITLTVTDADGNVAEDSITLQIFMQ